jgi:hypothetical protein
MAKVFDFSQVKFGKLAPRHDVRSLPFRGYVRAGALDAVPATFDYTTGVAYQMWANGGPNGCGDCTCAASAGLITTWNTKAGKPINLSAADVLAVYSAVTGYDPTTGANDNGAVILDVLKYLRSTGMAGHVLGAYGDVSIANLAYIKAACYYCEGLSIGVALPAYCESTTVWDHADSNVVGGHDILLMGVLPNGNFRGVTWGELIEVSPSFLQSQCDELHWALAQDQFPGGGAAANGLNLAAIEADVAAVGQFDTPPIVTPPPPAPVPPGPQPIPPGPIPPTGNGIDRGLAIGAVVSGFAALDVTLAHDRLITGRMAAAQAAPFGQQIVKGLNAL